MLFGGDVAEHGRAVHADDRCTDSRSDVVVARCHVDGQRPEGVEGRLVAQLLLERDVLGDLVQRHVARSFDHHLDVVAPRHLGEFTEGGQFG